MHNNIMLDLETLGTSPGCAILSIGAVKFSSDEVLESFYTAIDLSSCMEHGLSVNPETLKWWMSQPAEAKKAVFSSDTMRITEVLERFTKFCGVNPVLWGNGATFDNVILKAAYQAVGAPYPVKYTNDRCYRTMLATFPGYPKMLPEVDHHALYDADAQAQTLISLVKSYSFLKKGVFGD